MTHQCVDTPSLVDSEAPPKDQENETQGETSDTPEDWDVLPPGYPFGD